MFAKKFRLPLGRERVRWQRNFPTAYFLIKTSENKEGHNRFGIIIASSSVKKSTRRHFWKRQFAAQLSGWPNFKKDFLIIISPKIETAEKTIIKKELERILSFIIGH